MSPETTYVGGFRFEKGYLAKALYYSNWLSNTEALKWTDQFTVLLGASMLGVRALTLLTAVWMLIL